MKIKVTASFSGKISTGSYENANPFFGAEVEYELEGGESSLEAINTAQKELHSICLSNFKHAEQQAIVERIRKERKDIRFRKLPTGELVPSVTSIINFDADFYVSAEDLLQYAAQSTIEHKKVSHYWKEGKILSAKELIDVYPELTTDYMITTKGTLGLTVDGADFEGFLKKYPFIVNKWDEAVHSVKHEYAGELDYFGMPQVDEKEGIRAVLTMCDVKRTADRIKAFMQMSAYAKAKEEMTGKATEQLMIVPLNDKTKQGWSKPIVTKEIDKYFALFLDKRKQFRKRYGA